jgi:heme A synthase
MGHRLWAGVAMLMVLAATVLGIMRRHEIPGPSRLLVGGALLILVQAALGGVTVLTELHGFVRLTHLALGMGILGLLTGAGLWLIGAQPRRPILPLRPWHLTLMGAAVIMVGGSIVATQTTFDCSTLPTCDGGSSSMATWLHSSLPGRRPGTGLGAHGVAHVAKWCDRP